jgi:hypothetical protein
VIFHWRNDVKNVMEIVTIVIIFTYHRFHDAIIYMCSLTVTVHVIDNTVYLHLGMLKYSYRLFLIVQGGPNWYWAAVVNSVTCSYSQARIISNSSQLVWILYNCDLLSLGMFNVKWWHSVFRWSQVQILAQRAAVLTEVLHDFCHFLKPNTRRVPYTRLYLLPATLFQFVIH